VESIQQNSAPLGESCCHSGATPHRHFGGWGSFSPNRSSVVSVPGLTLPFEAGPGFTSGRPVGHVCWSAALKTSPRPGPSQRGASYRGGSLEYCMIANAQASVGKRSLTQRRGHRGIVLNRHLEAAMRATRRMAARFTCPGKCWPELANWCRGVCKSPA
jgi:hypothetical protein